VWTHGTLTLHANLLLTIGTALQPELLFGGRPGRVDDLAGIVGIEEFPFQFGTLLLKSSRELIELQIEGLHGVEEFVLIPALEGVLPQDRHHLLEGTLVLLQY
jgi:hypothetical protein